jgi:pSer/pThr/pTyr-binding forkhead associated (FHA) protein
LELEVLRSRAPAPEHIVLDRPFALIGSDRRCEVRLKATGVAPRHAYLQRIAGRTFILDLGSRKGLLLQGKKRTSGWLAVGESVGIGPYSLTSASAGSNGSGRTAGPHDLDPLEAGSVDRLQLPTVLVDLPGDRGGNSRRRIDRVLTLVGRAPCCHLRFSDPSVPRIQCALLLTSVGLWVIDLRGRDGTCVDGCQVRWAHLEDGANLQIGRGNIRVCSQQAKRAEFAGPFLEVVSIGDHPAEAPAFEPSPSNGHAALSDLPACLPLAPIPPSAAGAAYLPTVTSPIDTLPSVVTTQQLAMMQQQMLVQFQQSMLMMAQTFSGMWQSEMELLREVLDRLGGLKRQVRGLSARQKAIAKRSKNRTRAALEKPRRNGAVEDTVPMTPPKQMPQAPPAWDAAAAANVDPNFHMWLNERISSLDQERRGAWQKLCAILLGK